MGKKVGTASWVFKCSERKLWERNTARPACPEVKMSDQFLNVKKPSCWKHRRMDTSEGQKACAPNEGQKNESAKKKNKRGHAGP